MSIFLYLFTFTTTALSLKYICSYFIIERHSFLLKIDSLKQDVIILEDKVQDLTINVSKLKKQIDDNIKIDKLIISKYNLI